MNCPQCGVDVVSSALFCHKCGFRLDEAGLERPPEAAEAPGEATDSPPEPVERSPEPQPAEKAKSPLSPKGDDDEPETDLWAGGYSGKAMWGSWILAGIVTLALLIARIMALIAFVSWPILLGLIAALWIVLWLRLVYLRLNYHYALTTQRFIHRAGILRRTTDRIEVIDIDDVTYEQGLIERMVGVGTIKITSSDRTHPQINIVGIAGVKNVAESIDSGRRKERLRRGLHIEAI